MGVCDGTKRALNRDQAGRTIFCASREETRGWATVRSGAGGWGEGVDETILGGLVDELGQWAVEQWLSVCTEVGVQVQDIRVSYRTLYEVQMRLDL